MNSSTTPEKAINTDENSEETTSVRIRTSQMVRNHPGKLTVFISYLKDSLRSALNRLSQFIFTNDTRKNLLYFLPMRWLLAAYLAITTLYITSVTGLPSSWDLKYLHHALSYHPFLTDTLKGFLALSAVVIAWHRSISTEHQIELTASSNRISQYYNIREHFDDLISNEFPLIDTETEINQINEDFFDNKFTSENTIITIKIEITEKESALTRIFNNPTELDFGISSSLSILLERSASFISDAQRTNDKQHMDFLLSEARACLELIGFKINIIGTPQDRILMFTSALSLLHSSLIKITNQLPISKENRSTFASSLDRFLSIISS